MAANPTAAASEEYNTTLAATRHRANVRSIDKFSGDFNSRIGASSGATVSIVKLNEVRLEVDRDSSRIESEIGKELNINL